MPLLPSLEVPFGLLDPLHQLIVHGQAITSSNWIAVLVLPLAPLGFQALLLQYEHTRPYRMAIGAVGFALLAHSFTHYRYTEPTLNVYNIGLGTAGIELFAKYIEFSLLRGPVVDPYVAKGRGWFLAAFDLPINTRWIGLGETSLEEFSYRPRSHSNGALNGVNGVDGVVKVDGEVIPANRERWLPYPSIQRTRLQACLRHLGLFTVHYIVVDSLVGYLHVVSKDTIADARGSHAVVAKMISTNEFILLPFLQHAPFAFLNVPKIHPPVWFIETTIEAFIALIVWQSLSMGYRAIAFVMVGSGFYETDAWEVDLFDQPWKADSILNMWGRRWHQIFRRHFLIFSSITLRLFHLPITSSTLVPIIFFYSGMLHVLGQLMSNPTPYPPPVLYFFLFSGMGAVCEALFSRVTGRRVRGPWGRLWMWTFLFTTGKQACWAWCDSGVGSARFTPPIPGFAGFGPAFLKVWGTVIAEVNPIGSVKA